MLTTEGMLIRRCAWHRQYTGRPRLYGVAGWRGLGVAFTDGVCRDCAAKLRGEILHSRAATQGRRSLGALLPSLAVAAVAIAAGLLAARS